MTPKNPSKHRKTTYAAIGLLVLISTLFALAATALPSRPTPLADLALESPIVDRLAERLDLDIAQRQHIRSLLQASAPEVRVHLETIKEARLELFQTIHSHPSSPVEVRAAAALVAEAEADLAVLRADLAGQVHSQLNASQQAELETLKVEAVRRIEGLAELLKWVVERRLAP